MPALAVEQVNQIFGQGTARVQVLHDVNFAAESGQLTLIVGPSGSGKTTLLTIAGGLLTPTSGQVQVAGESYQQRSPKEKEQLRLNQIGFVLQAYHLLPYLMVADQFKLVDRIRPQGNLAPAALTQLLTELGIAELLNKFPNELSGGQQQRVAIARALYPDPAIVLADEPTAALDSPRVQAVGQMLHDLAHNRKKAIVVVTHDERLLGFADAVYKMEDGRLTQIKQA
ncbi:MAG: ABC transporter ATP-binding protein [Lactobacillus sp.]|jgi:putative ABC transport system ATP-binding protein|uniref:Putative hemin import ATP-binding protein HrtA n=1 Tax=Lacticaseibacillus suilingensis TaxID=2799577 RepID=A0ABW4BI54_9LACO|nr:ABC transporter ATP-binding protein [Lacticaseibacillus suilingensis]MCI1894437.1 ABC transporter ATP-binding protein [Lactobacillus sp.]MCI1917009.1 ABC transporter ATP-binding protein [Lactobacillus sp.]MCI1941742.1 ABC transporter ATP-binding protein [Lactobacillus sp.]MCI1972321.1 ABC transporter ATP-binding protein [Lactobacillus sp.]MCI2016861.1 ABC transporter ATP-binding protein [Lactobacillus sp.]